jgi:hypothetical protein
MADLDKVTAMLGAGRNITHQFEKALPNKGTSPEQPIVLENNLLVKIIILFNKDTYHRQSGHYLIKIHFKVPC